MLRGISDIWSAFIRVAIRLRAPSEVTVDVHSLMQHPTDVERRFGLAIGHNVRPHGVLPIPVSHGANATGLTAPSQRLHRGNEIAVVAVSLVDGPVFKGVAPDIFEVGFSERRQAEL